MPLDTKLTKRGGERCSEFSARVVVDVVENGKSVRGFSRTSLLLTFASFVVLPDRSCVALFSLSL